MYFVHFDWEGALREFLPQAAIVIVGWIFLKLFKVPSVLVIFSFLFALQ